MSDEGISATYEPLGIRANAIAPGGIETNIGATITEPNKIGMGVLQKAGESPMGQPEEVANVALF